MSVADDLAEILRQSQAQGGDGATAPPTDQSAAPDQSSDLVKTLQQAAAGQLPPSQQTPPVQPQTMGSVLPVSWDQQGNWQWNPNAGIIGAIKSAFTLPGDVYSGAIPTATPEGRIDPDLLRRSLGLATMASPMNPAVRAGEAAIPGEVGASMVRPALSAPTAQELKDAASAGYTSARASGLEIHPHPVGQMAQSLQQDLMNEGILPKLAPGTFSVIDEIANPPAGGFATIANMETMRRSLGRVAQGNDPTDKLAATIGIRKVDDFLANLDPSSVMAGASTPEELAATKQMLDQARGNYAAAQRSNLLTGDLDRATTGIQERAEGRAEATGSGRNLDNAIRQRVASLLEKPQQVGGFSDPEIAMLQQVRAGGPVRNTSRLVGNLLGGGGGLGELIAGGAGAGLGAHLGGGAEGAAIGAMAAPTAGVVARTIANRLAGRSLAGVDEAVRARSPLYGQMMAGQPLTLSDPIKRALALRLLGAGVGAQQQ